ncbi:MAG TPA: heavy metal-associated domain-containing protein [Bacillota bacterium]|nr:heavy metal-associated domain-containing protein [Bacillota bacterium]
MMLNIPDMHCEMCVKRIDTALTEKGIAHAIDLGSKTVEVEAAKLTQAKQVLDDLGFTAEERS